MNEMSQVIQERLYSEERRPLGITKEAAGQQKTTKKMRQKKATNSTKPIPSFWRDKTDSSGDGLPILEAK
jgi:hypothetical protein